MLGLETVERPHCKGTGCLLALEFDEDNEIRILRRGDPMSILYQSTSSRLADLPRGENCGAVEIEDGEVLKLE
jgi:hypothetical protein